MGDLGGRARRRAPRAGEQPRPPGRRDHRRRPAGRACPRGARPHRRARARRHRRRRPLPGAVEALRACSRAAIVTSCTRALARARIAAAGLPAPAVVVTADDVTAGKPDPEPFLLAAEHLQVAAARCLVVEDAPAGLAAARAAGMATLAVAGTHALADLDADAGVPDLSHVRFASGPTGIRVAA
ncbi:HAD-IA family hydrolase [Pseudonocardia benzenivorans]